MLIDNLNINVVRKNVKTLRMTVSAPDGQVRVSAPTSMPEETIRDFIMKNLGWIRKQQQKILGLPQPTGQPTGQDENDTMLVDDLSIDVVRKNVKRLRITVCAPDGRVRVSAPISMADEIIRRFVTEKIGWIRKQQQKIRDRTQPVDQDTNGEKGVYYLGQRFRLHVVEKGTNPNVDIQDQIITLQIPPGMPLYYRYNLLAEWYRSRLREIIPPLLKKWEPIIGIKVGEWNIKRMKTRWGTCNAKAKRIWLSLELAKKPPECIEYVVVHEMVHFHEQNHSKRFHAHMDRLLPQWKSLKEELNKIVTDDITKGHD